MLITLHLFLLHTKSSHIVAAFCMHIIFVQHFYMRFHHSPKPFSARLRSWKDIPSRSLYPRPCRTRYCLRGYQYEAFLPDWSWRVWFGGICWLFYWQGYNTILKWWNWIRSLTTWVPCRSILTDGIYCSWMWV